ncbi:MAG: ATP-binding protein [Hyalangium sp.]|uniref:ATP-binding protein n=1 Tax=Hyalangium sp. TaxID=2028555 RepID=UPI00389A5AA3
MVDDNDTAFEVRERAAVAEVVTSVLRHDLRNRFASIRNASYYLMRQAQKAELWKMDPRVEIFFELIDRELSSAEQLLSARHPTGPAEHHGPVRLFEAVERALARSHIPSSIQVEHAWQERAFVDADDPESLVLLARCLIDNALEAMPEGGTLGVRTLRAEENRILLEVTDTGPGIPEDLRPKVLDPFMTTKPGHAGVGLCIVQRLALRNRAWMELKPGESVGTRVRVSFPIADGAEVPGGT